MLDDFAVFILTHGRPDKVYTYNTLRKSGYTRRIYLIVDDEDDARGEYLARYGEQVVTFSKQEIAKTFDSADNFTDRRAIVYARNASFVIARNLGITYFIQLDDDYYEFQYKYGDNETYNNFALVKSLDALFALLLAYFKSATNVKSIAFAQCGDYAAGKFTEFAHSINRRRKAMNSFMCSTERPFQFVGRVNEDVNTYTFYGGLGLLFLTIPNVAINQKDTQQSSGGMTELYLDSGTYIKSFYTVMFCPSSVRVAMMGRTRRRLHHKIRWANTIPMVLSDAYKSREAISRAA